MTDTEILEGAPVVLTFDGKPYKVRPLNISKSRAWRKQVIQMDTERAKTLLGIQDQDKQFEAMVDANPDQVLNMVVAYCEAAKSVNGDGPVTREIIEEGNQVELALAFEKIIEVEFPITAVTAGQKALLSAWRNKQ
jgi:uncharacterized protein YfcZ (UPF0381/DUF406 family)